MSRALSCILAMLCLASVARAEPPVVNVTVTNTAANPVPVAQQGPVAITSSAAAPVYVAPAMPNAREPVSYRFDKQNLGLGVDYTVPEGKILVLESVSVWAEIPGDAQFRDVGLRIREPGIDYINGPGVQYVGIRVLANGEGTQVALPDGIVPINFATGTLAARLYAQPGGALIFELPRAGPQYAAAVITVSGYLVPVGSPSLAP